MLTNPSFLFLDEPTSGLDSTIAPRLVSTLWELAKGGRTVVMTIHQPSSRMYYMFHRVLLLSEGNLLYFGKGSEAIEYFTNSGYAPTIAMNPSDFLLALANVGHMGKNFAGVYTDQSNEDHALNKHKLISAYRNYFDAKLKPVLHEITDYDKSRGRFEDNGFGEWPTSWSQQFLVLIKRDVKERSMNLSQACGFTFVGSPILQEYWRCLRVLSFFPIKNLQIGLLFFFTSLWGALPLYRAIFTFPRELMMLEKERSSGMYRLSSYFMSRMVGDLPMELVLPTIFLTIIYWMAGLKANVDRIVDSQIISHPKQLANGVSSELDIS
ncbi:ABC transporter G family member 9 [Spatholobus suberectus]|nr:ABC transporter G family member 9 [Spatholobus suberectus]